MYIGPYEIIQAIGFKDGWRKIELKGRKYPMIVPDIMYDKMISTEPMDLTALRERRVMPVVQELVKLLLKWDLKIEEIETLYTFTTNFIEQKKDFASAQLWLQHLTNRPEDDYMPLEVFQERTINDIDGLLESNKKEKGDGNLRKKGDTPAPE